MLPHSSGMYNHSQYFNKHTCYIHSCIGMTLLNVCLYILGFLFIYLFKKTLNHYLNSLVIHDQYSTSMGIHDIDKLLSGQKQLYILLCILSPSNQFSYEGKYGHTHYYVQVYNPYILTFM